MNSTAQLALDPKLPTGSEQQPPRKPALTIVSRSTQTRASNVARAALVVANLTPTGYRVGVFMADHARYAQASDVRRTCNPMRFSPTGRKPRLQPRWAVVSGRYGAACGPFGKRE